MFKITSRHFKTFKFNFDDMKMTLGPFGLLRGVNKSMVNTLELVSLYWRCRVVRLSFSIIVKSRIKLLGKCEKR